MSTFLAIAGVSTTLRNLLLDRMEAPVVVTIAPPDVSISGVTGRRANLYLYQINENAYLKNNAIPFTSGDIASAPLALELSYLITTFGSADNSADGDLEAQQILGDVMRVLHDIPIISDSLHEKNDPARPLIIDPSLVGQVERIKVTNRPATLDDIAKIWTESNFRRAVTYQVSAVQIDSKRARKSALPVREPRVYVFPLRSPFIDAVARVPPFDNTGVATAELGDTVEIDGRNFAGAGVSVRIDATEVPLVTQTDTRITVVLPATLAAGVRVVQVRRDVRVETTPGTFESRRGFESNVVAVTVLPRIVSLLPNGAGPGVVVTATIAPAVLAQQRKTLLLGDFEVQAVPAATPGSSTTIQFQLPAAPDNIPAGTYLARIRIDGTESRLAFDATTGQFTSPTYDVT